MTDVDRALFAEDQILDAARALARKLQVCPDKRSPFEVLEEGGGEWSFAYPTFFVHAFGINAKSTKGLDTAVMNWVKKVYRMTPDWYAFPSFLKH